ncbi:Broad specificity phosphatase PhoE [Paenibacillus sp. UNCCL117]|uniref:histidine phosphatase family protein n=1 Tax=unclassified Paenibacillus TaxID=185978 RepID=UPI00088941A7|nr:MULTISPECIES: histidine phosphatase family protein [unclassified Paenibacillus]SDC27326.1 Broad specificity phosphatase PhoE [Paenibacillus sp. cl123]SFW20309.1 Broad specificity phosphatase PhoE [Paenibacillus sp. UNCCL117]
MRLTFIRHGQLAGDPFICPERPVKGCLSEMGIRQAEATGEALKDEKYDFAFSSPYGRALQTAEVVLAGRNMDIKILPFIYEWMPNRDLENLPQTAFEEIQRQSQDAYAEETWKTELGEGYYDMCARIIPPFLKELMKLGIHSRMGGFVPENHAKDLSIVVFAHGGSLGVLLNFLLGVRPFPVGSFSFEHTGVAVIDFVERKSIFYPILKIPALCYG